MTRERLKLALETIPAAAWEYFEEFASEFLVAEFPGIRTMASMSGDKGRDAEIMDVTVTGSIKLQYSVAKDWKSKISRTAFRISSLRPKPTHLIYVTNQRIGADADDSKADLLKKYGIVLDVRDISYFLERRDQSIAAAEASKKIEQRFVDPLLSEAGLSNSVAPALTADEERIAFLHLSIDLAERDTSRNMTKVAFESLILAVLYGTTQQTAVPRGVIHQKVADLVRDTQRQQLQDQIDSALERSSSKRGKIKHIKSSDTFHISNSENERVQRGAEKFLEEENSFERDILAAIFEVDDSVLADEKRCTECVKALREIIEKLLLDYGEQFSRALSTGVLPASNSDRLEALLTELSFKTHMPNSHAVAVIELVLENGAETTFRHLRRLLDSYTVLALLKSTPDVQKTLRKIFTGGTVWLDASFILPLIAEDLSPNDTPSRDLVTACKYADIKLHVTSGVIEEVNAHLNTCASAARSSSIGHRIPFLLKEFLLQGGSRSGFNGWQEEVRGPIDPLTDIEDYLKEEFSITKYDLADATDAAPDDIRQAAQRFWSDTQRYRRAKDGVGTYEMDQLTQHDVENTVGVIQLRGQSEVGPAGYQHWFLTQDRAAKRLSSALQAELGRPVPSPVIDSGYLVQLIRFRPDSDRDLNRALSRFPVLRDLAKMESFPTDIIDRIEEIRSEIPNISQRRLRRKLRDEVNSQKSAKVEDTESESGLETDI